MLLKWRFLCPYIEQLEEYQSVGKVMAVYQWRNLFIVIMCRTLCSSGWLPELQGEVMVSE
jgi:hypothetical protein